MTETEKFEKLFKNDFKNTDLRGKTENFKTSNSFVGNLKISSRFCIFFYHNFLVNLFPLSNIL